MNGKLDQTFGKQGSIEIETPYADHGVEIIDALTDSNGHLYLAVKNSRWGCCYLNDFHIIRVLANGDIDPQLPDKPKGLIRLDSGNMALDEKNGVVYLVGTKMGLTDPYSQPNLNVVAFDLSGKPVMTFAQNGVLVVGSTPSEWIYKSSVLTSDGGLLVLEKHVRRDFQSEDPLAYAYRTVRIDRRGNVIGLHEFDLSAISPNPGPAVIWQNEIKLLDENRLYYLSCMNQLPSVTSLNSVGQINKGFGTNGTAAFPGLKCTGANVFATDREGRAYFSYQEGQHPSQIIGVNARLTATGEPDLAFGGGASSIRRIALPKDGTGSYAAGSPIGFIGPDSTALIYLAWSMNSLEQPLLYLLR
jgi:hypothetical protein